MRAESALATTREAVTSPRSIVSTQYTSSLMVRPDRAQACRSGASSLAEAESQKSASVRPWRGALAAVAGMLPLALAIGAGSQMLQPLAIAVIGGILISMLLSLIVTPAIQFFLA